jgi:hypothetical protein
MQLDYSRQELTTLPELSNVLTELRCFDNELIRLPKLPNSLELLSCSSNKLTTLPELPVSLTWLDCDDNELTTLPKLPDLLTVLNCGENPLTTLPKLPDSLITLSCDNSQLTRMPELPNSLLHLYCYNNQLTTLPKLPASLEELECNGNPFTEDFKPIIDKYQEDQNIEELKNSVNYYWEVKEKEKEISANTKRRGRETRGIMHVSKQGFAKELPLPNNVGHVLLSYVSGKNGLYQRQMDQLALNLNQNPKKFGPYKTRTRKERRGGKRTRKHY